MHESLRVLEPSLIDGGDREYFEYHRWRYERHLQTLTGRGVTGKRVLDIGSHYLHLSSALRRVGAEVIALDVREFQELPFVSRRAAECEIDCRVVEDLGRGAFLEDEPKDAFDVVLFCEILEHITFNPVRFWRRVYDLLRPGGYVYLTTPNANRLANLLKTLGRTMTLRGVGITVDAIYDSVTYGHHWKEYTARELRQYFARLSPDFEIHVQPYTYRSPGSERGTLAAPLRRAGNLLPALREHLEAIIELPAKRTWRAPIKRYED